MIPFVKMHGIGNDYLYVDARNRDFGNLSELAVKMSADHFGCATDGLILIMNSQVADFRMRMFNNDGSEAEMCGNGLRCMAKYCHDLKLTSKTDFIIETGAGLKRVHLTLDENGNTALVRADMGKPVLNGERIPSLVSGNPVIGYPLNVQGFQGTFTLISMGNPHAVTFVDDPNTAPVTTAGPLLECHEIFPNKANIEFVKIVDRSHIRMRVWERGAGETLACGTGACASVVAAVINGYCSRSVKVELLGGTLNITWDETTGMIYQEGSATFVYIGNWLEEGDKPC